MDTTLIVMRTYDEYKAILNLWEQGENKKSIARMTGIPRATVRDCINRYNSVHELEENKDQATKSTPDDVLETIHNAQYHHVQRAYAYLFGLYLGDGSISKNRRVHRLRIALDKKYPGIITACVEAIQAILPHNQVGIVDCRGCVNVSCYHKFWPQIFPQHGDGPKHQRRIVLEVWQQTIIDEYRLEFLRGLYHSDGSRFRNIVNGKDYPRYSFTNHSSDIRKLFCETCDILGIHWTLKRRGSLDFLITDVFISKRKDVEYLDRVIGPKN